MLLDEPTAHLDRPTADRLVADLRTALTGRVVVCVTHDDRVAGQDDTTLTLDPRVRVGRAETAGTGGWGTPGAGGVSRSPGGVRAGRAGSRGAGSGVPTQRVPAQRVPE